MRKFIWTFTIVLLLALFAACSTSSGSGQNGTANQPFLPSVSPTASQVVPTFSPKPTATATPTPTAKPTGAAHASPTTTTGKSGGGGGNNGGGAGNPPVTTSQAQQLARQLLQTINQDRAANNLPPYSWEAGLERSAYLHNLVMAQGCGLNHNCPGEPQLGARESNQGVQWNYAGENIGTGGPVATSYDSQWSMVLRLHQSMMAEKPPEDGHRQNLLSTKFHRIGISIYVDAKNRLWLTEDFAN
ncbi:MAG: CAP domain-containing protein [Ktedonobacteraceae bacterium]|nr:CAP domain-containing protein [Ktedonobacteraceae bacterium]